MAANDLGAVWNTCFSWLLCASDFGWWRGLIVSSWHTTQRRGLKEHTSDRVNGFLTGDTSVTSSFALEATLFLAYVMFSDTFFAQLLRYVNLSSNDSSSAWLPLYCCSHWRIRRRTSILGFLTKFCRCFYWQHKQRDVLTIFRGETRLTVRFPYLKWHYYINLSKTTSCAFDDEVIQTFEYYNLILT